ncbi:helix-turn-helix domain-containing protein [Legionella pneumophila serogroup 1]|nr:hypothetical protein [Legionella pneumophila]
MKIKLSPDRLGSPKSMPPYNNSIESQQARILSHFKICPRLSTIEARNKYGILHPGGRMMELRKKGHIIHTHWIYETDSNGVHHRVGLYVYHGRR